MALKHSPSKHSFLSRDHLQIVAQMYELSSGEGRGKRTTDSYSLLFNVLIRLVEGVIETIFNKVAGD